MKPDIFAKAFTTTYAIVSGNVTDPLSRGSKWIYAANPMIGSPSPDLRYPIITIEPYSSSNSEPLTFGTYMIETDIGTTIEVHDNAAGSRFDNTCGSLIDGLWRNAEEFAKSGLQFMFLPDGVYDNIPISNRNRIHIKSFGLGFKVK